MLTLTRNALQSVKLQNTDGSTQETAFPMLVNCLLDCLHQQVPFVCGVDIIHYCSFLT